MRLYQGAKVAVTLAAPQGTRSSGVFLAMDTEASHVEVEKADGGGREGGISI